MKEILIKLALSILTDKEAREKIIIVILSIVVGVLLLLLAPVAVLFSLGEIEAPEISGLDESAYIASLDGDQQAEIAQMEADGQTIAEVMKSFGIQEQTIKAQLLYFSCFKDTELTDYLAYANLFANAPDDAVLIENINQTYGLDIVYEDFMQSYTWVMNTTINEYLFADAATKNKPDLAAWARNAYVSGWAYQDGAFGEIDAELRYRCADNAGLILGYLRYNPTEKVFAAEPSTLYYTVKGNLDTMPDEEGVVLFDGTNFGVYVGNGEVIFSSADSGCVTKASVADGAWNQWAEVTGIQYNTEIVFEEYDGTQKNNLGLVEWAKQARKTAGVMCTELMVMF